MNEEIDITTFSANPNSSKIAWKNNNELVALTLPGLVHALVDGEKAIVCALVGSEKGGKIYGYSKEGKLIFETRPPPGYLFSYLTHHPKASIAVVAGGEVKVDGWRDWHFSIDTKTGELIRISPAY